MHIFSKSLLNHVSIFAACALSSQSAFAVSEDSSFGDEDGFAHSQAVSDKELSDMRGGFNLGGLNISFSFTSTASINGQIQQQLTITSQDLANAIANRVQTQVQQNLAKAGIGANPAGSQNNTQNNSQNIVSNLSTSSTSQINTAPSTPPAAPAVADLIDNIQDTVIDALQQNLPPEQTNNALDTVNDVLNQAVGDNATANTTSAQDGPGEPVTQALENQNLNLPDTTVVNTTPDSTTIPEAIVLATIPPVNENITPETTAVTQNVVNSFTQSLNIPNINLLQNSDDNAIIQLQQELNMTVVGAQQVQAMYHTYQSAILQNSLAFK